jgi:hypothetical protein
MHTLNIQDGNLVDFKIFILSTKRSSRVVVIIKGVGVVVLVRASNIHRKQKLLGLHRLASFE